MENYQKHGGTWKLFDDESVYQGELHINYENRVIALELILQASEHRPAPRAPFMGRIPFICGTLFSGAKILLYDCHTGHEHTNLFQFTRQVIYANYAFWGLSATSMDDIRFPEVIVDFGNVMAWSGLCRYKWVFNEKGGSDLLWSHELPIEVDLRDNLHIAFFPSQGSIGGDMFDTQITAHQYVKTEFRYAEPVPWETVLDDVLNIQYLIGIGVNQKVEIDSMEYCHDSMFFELPTSTGEVVKHFRKVPMIIGIGEPHRIHSNMAHEYLYTLPQIIANNAIKKWCENYGVLKPVLDLYFTASSNIATTPEISFLTLTQALETYHARFMTNDARFYPDRVAQLVDSFCSGGGNEQQWIDYLLDENQKKNRKTITLRSRLADLTFADGKFPFLPEGRFPIDYIRKIVDTRNYYTHYDPDKQEKAFTKEQLPWVNAQLIVLLEYHILVLLGFDSNDVGTRTAQKVKEIEDSCSIQCGTHRTE